MTPPPPRFEARLRHRVHDGLTLEVMLSLDDECGVLFGRSGAGKTTILRLIAGLVRPDAGTIRLDDAPLFDREDRVDRPIRERRIGLIAQRDTLFPHRSVEANLRFGLSGWSRAEADARVAVVAELCGIGPLLGRRPDRLSGGERQRVALARALAPRPRLLLADEPFSALDAPARALLAARLAEVRRAEGVPLLFVTHQTAEAVALGDRLFRLDGGRIVDEGPPMDVLARAPGADGLRDLRNVLTGTVAGHEPGATRLDLRDGPTLIVPRVEAPPGAVLRVSVLAEEILLACGPLEGISARNVLPGVVERVIPHGEEAEVLVRTGGVVWVVSVVAPAVTALRLQTGSGVRMIVKARSCHLLGRD